MIVTSTNKNLPMSKTNPYMIGFPTSSSDKNIPVLVSRGMTVVLVNQYWDNFHKTVKERKVTRVITPGTYIENPPSDDFYNICCVHIAGATISHITVMDLSVGNIETLTLVGPDELVWFVEYYNPVEIIVLFSEKNNIDALFEGRTVYHKCVHDKNHKLYIDQVCQHEILKKVNMDYDPQDINQTFVPSLVCLIDYVYSIHPTALTHLKFPKPYEFENRLTLYNNAVKQLDILSYEKKKGLFKLINRTKTAMGSRMLKAQLLNPMFDRDGLNRVYDKIELYKNANIKDIQNKLKNVPDIERLLKRLSLSPSVNDIKTFYQTAIDTEALAEHFDAPPKCGDIKRHIEACFCTDTWKVLGGVSEEIDHVDQQLRTVTSVINEHADTAKDFKDDASVKAMFGTFKILSLDNVNHLKLKNYSQIFKLKPDWKSHFYLKSDKQGHYVGCSSKGFKFLKSMNADTLWDIDNTAKTNLKLSSKKTKEILDRYTKILEQKETVYKDYVCKYVRSFATLFDKDIKALSDEVAQLDCVVSKAAVALEYEYTRPCIAESHESFIEARTLRHPIVEQCIDDVYVGNDVRLCDSGMLLYGMNGSGKSTFGKAVALNLILAQSGFFVAAESFRYAPFKKIFVRINCDDDIYKGYSSFHVEMNELRTITRLADTNSLVIGDEVCKGTEEISAVAIVAATVKWMTDKRIKFVLATHLHKLLNIDFIKELKLQIKHVSATYDNQREKLVFTRTLHDGNGDEVYGINVAKCVLKCPEMHTLTMQAQNQLVNNKKNIISNKKSRYNKTLLMDQCAHCGSIEELHTHHIKHQKDCKDSKTKNVKTNLMVLCRKCHEAEHKN